MQSRIGALGPIDTMQQPEGPPDPHEFETFDDAMDYLARRGLAPPPMPLEYRGEMPVDLTSLDDEQLGDLLNRMSAWCGFVEFELAKVGAMRSDAEAQLDLIRSKVRILLRTQDGGRKMPQKDKDDYVETNEDVRRAKRHYNFTDSLYGLMRTLNNKAQRDWDTVSRRITQRGQEVERMKRENSVAGVPVASRFRRGGQGRTPM